MGVVIAIDAGTTGVRSLAVDEGGDVRGVAYREFTQHFPRPGWVEHDAGRDLDAVADDAGGSCAPRLDGPVAAIGITNQRETRGGLGPAHRRAPATGPSCGRTAAPPAAATRWPTPATCRSCGSAPASCSTRTSRRTKMAWLLTEGGVAAGADLALGTVDTWVLWNLTGGAVHATDPSNASRTMLYDIGARRWSAELAELFGVPLGALPEVRPSSGRFGTTVDGCGRAGRHPGLGHRRRPAGRAVRPGLLHAGHDEEHLRHGLASCS